MGRERTDDQLRNLTAADAEKLMNVSRKCCAVCCLKRRRCRNKLNIISFIHFHFQQQADRRKGLTLWDIAGVTGAEAERNALVAKITKEENKGKNKLRMRKTRAEKRAEDKKKEKAEEASSQLTQCFDICSINKISHILSILCPPSLPSFGTISLFQLLLLLGRLTLFV